MAAGPERAASGLDLRGPVAHAGQGPRVPTMAKHPPQPQLAAAWWQAVRQLERALSAAGAQNHRDLDHMEHWLTSGGSPAALVALAMLTRLQPLYRRTAEGQAWANALRQAHLAWASVPPSVASDPVLLEAHLQRRPHLTFALQQPRLIRQMQRGMGRMPSEEQRSSDGPPGQMAARPNRTAAASTYAYSSVQEHRRFRKPAGEKQSIVPSTAMTGPACYEEIAHRHNFGRWMSHHIAPDSDCSVHGVPSCGQAYAIELAQQLAARPAIARLLPGSQDTRHKQWQSIWTNRDQELHHLVESMSGVDVPDAADQLLVPQAPPDAPTSDDTVVAVAAAFEEWVQQTPLPPTAQAPGSERTAQGLRETLSALIQTHAQPKQLPDPQRPLQDCVPGALGKLYQNILDRMTEHTKKGNEYGERRRIDIHADPMLSASIDQWIEGVRDWLKLPPESDEGYELEGLCGLHFLTHSEHLNDLSLQADILEMRDDEELRIFHQTVNDLCERYGIPEKRAKELIRDVEAINYTIGEFIRTMGDVGRLGQLKEQKLRLIGILSSLTAQGALRGAAPLFYKDVVRDNDFLIQEYYQYYSAFLLSDLIGANAESQLEKTMVGMEQWLNYQLLYCVYFGAPPKEDFLGLYNALLRGREASATLLSDGLKEGLPATALLVGSTASLMAIDYRLSLLNLTLLPLTIVWAKFHNRRLQALHKKGVTEIDRSARSVSSAVRAARELRNLGRLPEGFEKGVRQLLTERQLVRAKGSKEAWASYLTFLPMTAAFLLSMTVGDMLGLAPMTMLATGIAANGMHYPMQRLIKMILTTAPPLALDVKHMQKRLPDLHTLDLPEGPTDMARTPVSELPDLKIEYRDVGYIVPKTGGIAELVLLGEQEKEILKHVDLVIEPGRITCLAGISGSGKTTLILMLAGAIEPTSGTLTVGGVPRPGIRKYGGESLINTIHYAAQHPNFFPDMTIMENILFNLPAKFDNPRDIAKAQHIVERLVARLHFSDQFNLDGRDTDSSSGGERARIALIRACLPMLMGEPGILIADEPTAPLDPESEEYRTPGCAEAVIALLEEVAAMGNPVVCVSHDPKLWTVSHVVPMADINVLAKDQPGSCD